MEADIGQGRLRGAQQGDLDDSWQRRESGLDVQFVEGTILDDDALDAAFDGATSVVHLAARVGVVGSAEDFERVNVDGTREVLRLAGLSRTKPVQSPWNTSSTR